MKGDMGHVPSILDKEAMCSEFNISGTFKACGINKNLSWRLRQIHLGFKYLHAY